MWLFNSGLDSNLASRCGESLNSPLWSISRLESSASWNMDGKDEVRVSQRVMGLEQSLDKVSIVQMHIQMPGTIIPERENDEHTPQA